MTPAVLTALPTHPAPLTPALAGLPTAFTPSTTAVGGNVYLTAAVGLLPLVVFFVLMGVFKVATHWCAIISLVVASITAVALFHMPVGMTVMSATQGMALGFVPIVYIIIAAVWLYNLTDVSGRSKDLRAVFNVIGKGDMRAQALIVAFSFCGLLEGLAGFGAPVAIAAAMVATLGLPKLKAAVVVSSAIRESNPELAVARRRGQRILHRSQALALAAAGRDFVAVAGAHGKTTTSAMIATALNGLGLDPSWAIGGTVMGVGGGGRLGGGRIFVAEADESDASFLNYAPRLALVTNVEPDHLDHYGSREAFEEAFADFTRRIVPGGLLVVCADSDGARRLAAQAVSEGIRAVSYGRGQGVDGVERHVRLGAADRGPSGISGEVDDGDGAVTIELGVVGEHNLLNAAGAWTAGVELGVGRREMAAALAGFAGTGRRFELRGVASGVRVVDDYAHHPTEVEATLRTARDVVGDGAVRVLFQPHLYSRTREFAREFARALGLADDVVVTSVYGAREDPVDGVEGDLITSHMAGAGQYVADRLEAARAIASRCAPGDLVLTVGAGDVTELAPVILETIGAP